LKFISMNFKYRLCCGVVQKKLTILALKLFSFTDLHISK